MDDSMDVDYFKRQPREPSWDTQASIVNSETSAILGTTWGTDGIATPVTAETSQMAASHNLAAEAASLPEGLLESLAGSASITPASSATTSDTTSAMPSSISSLSVVSETTIPLTVTLTFPTASSETAMTLSGTVVSTTTTSSSALETETAALGAYSGGGDSVKTKLAIALPIAIVGLLVILALIFFFVRRRKHRKARPPYEMSGTKTPGVSTAALMTTTPKIAITSPQPATVNLSRLPVIDVMRSQDHEHAPRPGSASARSDDDPRTELGVAVAVPMDQRLSATEHDLREFSRPVSSASHRVSAGPPSGGLASVRMPFENQSSDETDAVSIISGEHGRTDHERDFDDMSSVSSFDDEHPRIS